MHDSAASATGVPGHHIVVGVDTHRDTHVAAAIATRGEVLECASFPTTTEGYRQLVDWAAGLGIVTAAGIEGTGSYDAALARHMRGTGITVTEVNRPDRALRRRHGKSGTVDAEAAARAGHFALEDHADVVAQHILKFTAT